MPHPYIVGNGTIDIKLTAYILWIHTRAQRSLTQGRVKSTANLNARRNAKALEGEQKSRGMQLELSWPAKRNVSGELESNGGIAEEPCVYDSRSQR